MSSRFPWAVTAGGGLGALVRYELELHVASPTPPAFPTVTLAINLGGAFLLGLLLTLLLERWPPTRYARSFLAIGVLGGFTTFSTVMVESDRLLGAGLKGRALAYLAVSLVGGLVAVAAGAWAARALPRGVRGGGAR